MLALKIPAEIGDAGMIPGVDITEIQKTKLEHANKESDHNDMLITPAATVPTTDGQLDKPSLLEQTVKTIQLFQWFQNLSKLKRCQQQRQSHQKERGNNHWHAKIQRCLCPP